MEIDPRFKSAKRKSARRQFRAKKGPLIAKIAAGAVAVAAVLWIGFSGVITVSKPLAPKALSPEELAQNLDDLEDGSLDDITAISSSDPLSFASAFVDVPGDPMVLRLDVAAQTKAKTLPAHPDLSVARVGQFALDSLVFVQDEMITQQEQLITTLPSSRAEFAFFQAQRSQSIPSQAPVNVPDLTEVSLAKESPTGDSWGNSIDGQAAEDSFTPTTIENITSSRQLTREVTRTTPHRDLILRVKSPRPLADILAENDFAPDAAAKLQDEGAAFLPQLDMIPADFVLAVRGINANGNARPVQLSLYGADQYQGGLAVEAGDVIQALADPWIKDDLFEFAGETEDGPVSARKYRLLDAFYSAGIRNGVPTAVMGEIIVLLSQSHDLDAFASPGDRMTLLFAREPGPAGIGQGQVLYAAIERRSTDDDIICFVVDIPGEGFGCVTETGAAPGVYATGMVTPVLGVLSSGFGPRFHPILRTTRLHQGVDWAAPTGTPVSAAFDGRVAFAGDAGAYGNLIKLLHVDGRETRYAHLSKFAPNLTPGQVVRAGQVIGYVGSTGRSTGPHLHFELLVNGQHVDPFASGTVLAGGSQAVDTLVDQIIRVESAGVVDAKNPLSSATGLGQFISSTWIRMMRTYRPDLAATLSRDELLKLRFDPTLSREMVTNLARESEAYLRARGHAITAGRLYLAHFLGAEGAHTALSSPDQAQILDVMGAAVVAANPFLRNRDIAYVKAWADRKMAGRNSPAPTVSRQIPPEIASYKRAIQAVLENAG